MKSLEHVQIRGETFWLTAERCIYWESRRALILSDLHLGKTGHFRKMGIAIPHDVYKKDLHRLLSQIQYFKPKTLLVVGDMFHSKANREMELFLKWRDDLSHLEIRLVKGNHDILHDRFYEMADIHVYEEHMQLNNFCFTHDMETTTADKDDVFFFSGHIHPGIELSGLGKQGMCFPCFYFTDTYAVLPAFSLFTGIHRMKPKAGDIIYAIGEDKLFKVS
jgi:uncharacterized protein